MRYRIYCVIIFLICQIAPVSKLGAAELFSHATDTISIAGNTVLSAQCTYEATVTINQASYSGGFFGGSGLMFNSWQSAAEDEALGIYNDGSFGFAFPLHSGNLFTAGSLSLGTWYDLAYVYDGTQERLYINGNLALTRASSGGIGSGSSNIAAVGAIFRDGGINQSFLGEIQSLRISNTARYSGSSYSATLGDFSNDSSTLLLYNFDTAPINRNITDLSGHSHTGTLGTGFGGASSPSFVALPEPSGIVFACACAGTFLLRRRRSR